MDNEQAQRESADYPFTFLECQRCPAAVFETAISAQQVLAIKLLQESYRLKHVKRVPLKKNH